MHMLIVAYHADAVRSLKITSIHTLYPCQIFRPDTNSHRSQYAFMSKLRCQGAQSEAHRCYRPLRLR